MGERGMTPGDNRAKDAGARRGKAALAPMTDNPLEQTEIPPAPKGITKRTRRIWDALWTSPIAGALDWKIDQPAISRWAYYVDRWYRVFKQLEREDIVVSGSQGQDVLNPLSAELARLDGFISKLEKDLGLTPMARARLGLTSMEGQLVAAQLNEMVRRSETTATVDITDYDEE